MDKKQEATESWSLDWILWNKKNENVLIWTPAKSDSYALISICFIIWTLCLHHLCGQICERQHTQSTWEPRSKVKWGPFQFFLFLPMQFFPLIFFFPYNVVFSSHTDNINLSQPGRWLCILMPPTTLCSCRQLLNLMILEQRKFM